MRYYIQTNLLQTWKHTVNHCEIKVEKELNRTDLGRENKGKWQNTNHCEIKVGKELHRTDSRHGNAGKWELEKTMNTSYIRGTKKIPRSPKKIEKQFKWNELIEIIFVFNGGRNLTWGHQYLATYQEWQTWQY